MTETRDLDIATALGLALEITRLVLVAVQAGSQTIRVEALGAESRQALAELEAYWQGQDIE